MRRVGAFVGGVIAGMLVTGCFSDPSEDPSCSPGMEGCACVDLECEQGLTCMGGTCMAAGGSSGSASGTDPSAGVTTSTTSGPSGTTSTTGQSATETSSSGDETTTSGADSSSGGDPPGTESSSSSSTGADLCGNFMLDGDEECDGGNGCSDTCELEVHECNPLNNAPCPEGFKCSWRVLQEEPFTAYFTCVQSAAEPLADGEGNCFEMNNAQDQLCELGLACFNSNFLEGCAEEGCCTQYCNVNDADPCTTEGYTCMAETDLAPGMDFLGVCRP